MDQGDNPYVSPTPEETQVANIGDNSFGYRMRHLTRIVGEPYGVNILGLLEIFAMIGLLTSIGLLGDNFPRLLNLCVILIGFFGTVSFDVWWRIQQPEAPRWQRLLSPYTGGCFIFVPIWLLFSGGVVFFLIALVVRNT